MPPRITRRSVRDGGQPIIADTESLADSRQDVTRTPSPISKEPPKPPSPLQPISPWPPKQSATSQQHTNRRRSTDTTPCPEEPALPNAKEVYGLLAVFLTYIAYPLYLAWAFCPPHWLDAVGWTWYPDREWAIIIPCYLMVLVLLAYFSYAGLTIYNTPALTSPRLITDPQAGIPPRNKDEDPFYWRDAEPRAVPIAIDLPLEVVNRTLYRRKAGQVP